MRRVPDNPLRPVTESEVAAFEAQGAVPLRGVFPMVWIERMRDATEEAMASPGPHADLDTGDEGGRFFGDVELWLRHPAFREFVFGSPAARIARALLRSRSIRFFYDQLLVKEPGTHAPTPWHQDQPYWAVSGWQVASLWLPLDPVPRETAVELVVGSHRRGVAYNPRHFADQSPYADTGLPELPDIEAQRGELEIAAFALEPGDCLAFHAMMIHGAPGNPTEERRRALATRWTGDDARYRRGAGEVAIPTEDPGLEDGQELDSERFPAVLLEPVD